MIRVAEPRTGAQAYRTRPGSRFPPGATALSDGVNFCVFSRHATRVELLLYAGSASAEPFQVIELVPQRNRTFFFWHVFVEGLAPGTRYTWRVDGPTDTQHTATVQPAQGARGSVGAGRDRRSMGSAQGRRPP
jgi:glycogen operon protein